MAAGYKIAGPTTVSYNGSVLGYTDNDSLPAIDFDILNETVESSDTGRTPGEVIYMGQIARVTVTLVKWDQTVADALMVLPGGAAAGDLGTVGSLWFGGSYAKAVVITPTLDGERIHTFPRCYLDGPDAIRTFDIGNKPTRLAVSWVAVADGSDNVFTAAAVS